MSEGSKEPDEGIPVAVPECMRNAQTIINKAFPNARIKENRDEKVRGLRSKHSGFPGAGNHFPRCYLHFAGGGGIGDLKHTFSTDYEVILCASNGKELTGKRIGSVWTSKKDSSSSYVHPTQKPVKLSEFAIRNTTERGDIVLDLFGGSGSTLIACEQMERKCRIMEYDPAYCDVIVDRWEKLTGNKAELVR